MIVKKIIFTILALLMSSSSLLAKDSDDVVKIVYQCDFSDTKRIHLMLNTLNNAVEHYNEQFIDFDINIVASGACLQYFMKDFKDTNYEAMPYLTKGGPTGAGTSARIKNLQLTSPDNIAFYACGNTMKNNNVKPEQLESYVQATPAGIIKVIDFQREGYSYIKIH